MKNSYLVTTLEELDSFAQQMTSTLIKELSAQQGATIVTLNGDLGSGKTTLSQMIGKHLGVTEPIASPTFVISKYYDLQNQSWTRLIHIDAYRLEGQNLTPMNFPELFTDSNNILLIEWPEYMSAVLPKQHTAISIVHNKDDSRQIDID